MPGAQVQPWSARAVVHPAPLYHIEGEPDRRGDGIYDRMRRWARTRCWSKIPGMTVRSVERQRRGDRAVPAAGRAAHPGSKARRALQVRQRFQEHGASAGQEFDHPTSQLTATTFVPRRVLYELRAGREYFKQKERCVFCDIISQEMQQNLRVVEMRGDFVALCPYAPRVPYETWILPRTHEAAFERFARNRPGILRDLAALLRHTLQRIRTLTEEFHLVLHTSPNSLHPSATLGYWKTIDEDYHWHIEILPILASKAKSYTFKEVYYSPYLGDRGQASAGSQD